MSTTKIQLAEKGYIPDCLIRYGIRDLVKVRLDEIKAHNCEDGATDLNAFVAEMKASEIAPLPDLANAQHYEVPAAFFHLCLGEHKKYSGCYWDENTQNLDEAEALGLSKTCEHAGLQDGQAILELGCGWGSLSLWMASHYPNAQITGVSNSNSQREYIMSQAAQRGLNNLTIITADMNEFDAPSTYDRIVSVEMFEHMRNHHELLKRISGWLKPDGKLFVHIFCHKSLTYEFVDRGDDDWMSRHFFSGGMMPAADFLGRFNEHLSVEDHWTWSGVHYQKTCEAWLQLMDRNRSKIMPVLEANYGKSEAKRWFNRWRMFHMACSELFGFDGGDEWFVSHYRFAKIGKR